MIKISLLVSFALSIGLLCVHCVIGQETRQQASTTSPKVIRKSGRVLQESAVKRVEPVYPPLARAAKISGAVVVEVIVDEKGNVESAKAISGHPLLKDSAIEAAKHWQFTLTKLSGRAVKVISNIVFNFTLKGSKGIDEYKEKSLKELEKQVKNNPTSAQSHYELGIAYTKSENYNKAITELKEVIRINPKYPQVYYKLGNAYLSLDNFEAAIVTFTKAVQVAPDDFNTDAAYFALGITNLKLGRYKEAITAYKESIKISPSVVDSHLGLGIAHFGVNNYQEAIPAFKRVLEIDPELIGAHYWLGVAYFQTGDKKAALSEYEVLRNKNKDMAEQLLKEINSK